MRSASAKVVLPWLMTQYLVAPVFLGFTCGLFVVWPLIPQLFIGAIFVVFALPLKPSCDRVVFIQALSV